MIRYEYEYTNKLLRENPDWTFVFGDNARRVGRGGQAKVCRDFQNTFGFVTKWYPGKQDRDYFNDADPDAWNSVDNDISYLRAILKEGLTVVWPTRGVGTGRSEMPIRCPELYAHMKERLIELGITKDYV